MKIAVLSDTRMPTRPSGSHGLGRVAWDLATGLAKKGHWIELFAGEGSESGRELFRTITTDQDETTRAGAQKFRDADVWIDLSHRHDLSRVAPDWPVVNYIMDTECQWQPPRAVIGTEFGRDEHPNARVVPLGIDVDAIPFSSFAPKKLAYCHKLEYRKGIDLAMLVAGRSFMPIVYAGPIFGNHTPPPTWIGELQSDAELYRFLGDAEGLLSPAREDAGGRVNLESAACGTPVLTFDWTGTQYHVAHGVSGFICRNLDEMVDAVADLPRLDRRQCREWVAATHSLRGMIDGIEALAVAARDGERW